MQVLPRYYVLNMQQNNIDFFPSFLYGGKKQKFYS